MIDFYCNATGIGDSLLRTQAVHELAKQDKVHLIAPKFAWHGKRYPRHEDSWVNPIWLNNPDVNSTTVVDSIPTQFNPQVSGTQHHALDICNKYGIFDVKEPKLYLYPSARVPKPEGRKRVGVFLRKIEEESCVNYELIKDIVDILNDNDCDVYQIDAEERILENANQGLKNMGVEDLCNFVGSLDCVIGSSSGCSHVAKALGVKSCDIWDWKRFKQYTAQVFISYSYKDSFNFSVNGALIPGTQLGTAENIASTICGKI